MCIFCDIIDGKIPSKKIYEDDDVLAILDISQTTEGHTIVIPKKHFNNILETDDEICSKLICKTKKIANQIMQNLNAKGFNLLINTNETAGQTIMHTHIHIIPRYNENDTIEISFKNNQFNLDELLKKIKK